MARGGRRETKDARIAGAGPVRTTRPRTPEAGGACPLCGRPMVAGPSVDLHHPVPRSHGGRDVAFVHRVCHHKIHATFSEVELAREWHDWARLRDHPEIAAFVRWLRNKPPEFHDRSRRPNRRR